MGAKDRDCNMLIFYFFLLVYLCPSKSCYAIHSITSSQALSQGQTLVSPSQTFELGFFCPNNSANHQFVGIWYMQISPRRVVWVANRENPLRLTDVNSSLNVGSNGNLELLDGNNKSVWSTNITVTSKMLVAVLTDDGDFVLKDGTSEEELWHSFQHPGDTFLPGQVLRFNAKTGVGDRLTSWKTDADPSPGSFSIGFDSKRPPEVFIWTNGSTPRWRSGPWEKYRFAGIPTMNLLNYQTAFNLVEHAEEGTTYIYFNWYNKSSFASVVLSSAGVLKFMLRDKGGEWYRWKGPEGQCEIYGTCGPFAVCEESKSPICKCLKGFVPKSIPEWRKGNWTGGCARRNRLLCEEPSSIKGKKDGFLKIKRAKLPDFYVLLGRNPDTDTCQEWCLNNCSCLAYAYVNTIGCLVWSEVVTDIQSFSFGGEDLFVRLAHAELVGYKTKNIIIGLVAVFTGGILCAMVLALYKCRARKKEGNGEKTTEHADMIQHCTTELPTFDFNAILVATNHFSPKKKLGQGGFGSVYKGKLQDGKDIAVKRLSSSSGQGIQEFKNEMILISKLRHRNLVTLMGYCIEDEEKLLVYEFMPNKSLDIFIFDPRTRAHLNWGTRFNIINGIARGLVYLHRDSCSRVIHRDLKASNILLDEKMNPKVSDFGLARMFQGSIDLANTQRVVGTLGYMSPEYAMGGIYSEKSDVFSFGILILEIVSGQKNTNFNYSDQHLSLISWAWQFWSENRGLVLVDDALADSYSASEAIRCIHVGLLCVQDLAADRPSMPEVVSMLNNETNRSQPKQPMFTFRNSPKSDFQLQKDSKCSVNEASMSLIVGR